ncbi:MAG: YoaK family protein [Lachnospiraceae bacterium]|nr:YoaK family protein [Lachnospiraceae bacterium]
MKRTKQMSESMLLGVFLTLAGGFQDAYSYNCRDHVFANAQTGNIVLLGQNLAGGQFLNALRYLFPLLAFAGGVYVTEWVHQLYKEGRYLHWRQVILLAEILLLFLVGLMPQSMNTAANVLLSFACAMQVNSFRKFRGIPCATTMCIGNIRSATEMLCRYHIEKDSAMKQKSLCYYFIILVFAAGASIGAVLSQKTGNRAIWCAAGMMFVGFLLMFMKEEEEPETQEEQKKQEKQKQQKAEK